MHAHLDLTSLTALLIGSAAAARRAAARLQHAGAHVRLASADEAIHLLTLDVHEVDVVAWVEGPESSREQVRALAAQARLPLLTEAPAAAGGQVTLVGGGPGRWDLVTVAGRDALASADVVLYDRLGPVDGLADLAPGAQLIDVGKTPGHHAVPQERIGELLVEHALSGAHVVRLKGGDPFVFGRGAEEVAACGAAGVPVTVVPGITSAISVPSAVGIPVTHRGVSRAVTVVSGHVPFSEEEYAHLTGLGGTVVILMGVNTLLQVAAGLVRAGMDPGMPVAVVERGFHLDQRARTCTVQDAAAGEAVHVQASPAVIVIGEVVRLADPERTSDPVLPAELSSAPGQAR